MNIKAQSFASATCSRKYSLPQCLMYQSVGLIKPLVIQRSVITYFMQGLKQSQTKVFRDRSTAELRRGGVFDLDIDPRNRFLLAGGPRYLAIHDLEDFRDEHNGKRRIRNYKVICSTSDRGQFDTFIETVQWNPWDTGIFMSSDFKAIRTWDANLLKTITKYKLGDSINCHHMSTIATSHNLIAVGTYSPVVNLVDPRAGSTVKSLPGHTKYSVMAMQWSNRDEFILATGGYDNYAMLWDIRNDKRCLRKLQVDQGKTHDGYVNGLSFTADGQHLTTIGRDLQVFMWDTSTGRKLPAQYPPLSHLTAGPIKFCVTKGGSENFAFIPTGYSFTAINLSTPHMGSLEYKHSDRVFCSVYHEQGNQLITGDDLGKIQGWTRCEHQEYDMHLCK